MTAAPQLSPLDRCTETFAKALRPPPRMTVSQWADRFRVLPRLSAEPGRWKTSRTPFLREIMDRLSPMDPCHRVVLIKPAKIGASAVADNWAGYTMHLDPAPMMIVQPTDSSRTEYSKDRIKPLIDDTPEIKANVAPQQRRFMGSTTTRKEFPGGFLALVHATSGPELRAREIKRLVADEIDGWDDDVDGEGDPLGIVRNRLTTYADSKEYDLSTPVLKGGRIESEYLKTDQRHWFVPCPHCGQYQELRWSQVVWKQIGRRPDDAAYRCESCGETIEEYEKTWMLERGRWHPTVEPCPVVECGHLLTIDFSSSSWGEAGSITHAEHECPGCRTRWVPVGKSPERGVHGYRLSGLCRPYGWPRGGWGSIASAFVDATHRKDRAALQAVINLLLGEAWEDPSTKVMDPESMLSRVEDYDARVDEFIPAGAQVITVGGDIQLDRIELTFDGWAAGEESWSLDHVILRGDPEQPTIWQAVDRQLLRVFRHPVLGDLRPAAACIDAGYIPEAVHAFCKPRRMRLIFATRGRSNPRSGQNYPIWTPENRPARKPKKGKFELWWVGADSAKGVLLERMHQKEEGGPGVMHFGRHCGAPYFDQLTAERLRSKYVNGRIRYFWWKPHNRRNEVIDCRVLSLAALRAWQVSGGVFRDLERVERHRQERQEEGRQKAGEPKRVQRVGRFRTVAPKRPRR